MILDRLIEEAQQATWLMQVWFRTRRWHLVLLLTPLVTSGAALWGIVLFQRHNGNANTIVHYRAAADKAIERGDLRAGALYAEKLNQLAPSHELTRFNLARVALQRGDMTRGRELLDELAPSKTSGLPEAHFLRAKLLLREHDTLTPQDVEVLAHHLARSLEANEFRDQARRVLVDLYLAGQNWEQAIPQLEALSVKAPEFRLTLADVYAAAGDRSRADRELQQAVHLLQKQVESHPEDIETRILWARAVARRGDHLQAETILLAARNDAASERVRIALANLYVARFDELARQQAPLGQQLALLERALQEHANHEGALTRLVTIALSTNAESQQARDHLKAVLAKGEVPATVHLILGTHAAATQRWDYAKLHLEQAYRLNPQMPVLLNNLAWTLAKSPSPQLEDALALSNAAIEIAPDHSEIRATRGQILAQLYRWDDAIVDLEIALRGIHGRRSLHETLAAAYTQLGDDELAGQHQAMIEELGVD
jgi:predicted Zn-dependent protease